MGEETPEGRPTRHDKFHLELDALADRALEMARLAQEALEKSITALFTRDEHLARRVIEGDREINRLELFLDEECARVVALYQPVAADLRLVMAVDHINHELERIGDQSVNIAEEVLELLQAPHLELDTDLPRMTRRVQDMLELALRAFKQKDISLAQQVCEVEEEVDVLDRAITQELLQQMVGRQEVVAVGQSLINVVRNLERVGDHATNIGEHVLYLVEGEMVHTP